MRRSLTASAPGERGLKVVDTAWSDTNGSSDWDEMPSLSLGDVCPVPAVHVVGVCGSIRDGSFTKLALKTALEGCCDLRCKTTLVDLTELQLPFCDGSIDSLEPSAIPKNVKKWRNIIASATGVILASPEYHGSYSGVLKNALDLLPNGCLKGKVVGIVAVAAGALGGTNTISHLREVARSLHGYTIPDQAAISQVWNKFDEEGNMIDQNLRERVCNVGKQVALMGYLRANIKAQHFLQYIENFSTIERSAAAAAAGAGAGTKQPPPAK